MGKKLYVGNLPFSIDDQQLHQAFAAHGEVTSARVITDRDSGRSKGFGFVEMANPDDADAAISKMNGSELSGRAINVSEAREPERGGGRGPGGGGRGGGFRPRGGGPGGGGRGFRPRGEDRE